MVAERLENYFNYFTEIEEHFWKKRGTSLLVSTLDWALIDTWKQAQIPIEAVLKGIDRTFEKYEHRRRNLRKINSLGYCHQEVLAAAAECERGALPHATTGEPFSAEELAAFFGKNGKELERAAIAFETQGRTESAGTFRQIAESLHELQAAALAGSLTDLEGTERRLTVLEEKMFSTLLNTTPEAELVAIRAEMDRGLGPIKQNLGSEQITHLQKQFLVRRLLEKAALPRLSLFYL